MNAQTLLVNIRALLHVAHVHGWSHACKCALANVFGRGHLIEVAGLESIVDSLPDTADFDDLRKRLCGAQLLDAVDSLAGVDVVRTSGRLLLAIAQEIFVPAIPPNHPGYTASLALLQALADYLEGRQPAEHYMLAAYRYRCQYGTAYGVTGGDPEHECLFEAMPCDGLDSVIALGGWSLASHWESFGRFQAKKRDDYRLLDELADEVEETVLVESNPDADKEAEAAMLEVLDFRRDVLVDVALEDYDAPLLALIDRVLPAVVVAQPAAE